MSPKFRRALALAAILAASALLGATSTARAAITLSITVQEGAGPVSTIGPATGNPATVAGNVTTADYSVVVQSGTADESSSLTELLSAALKITKTGASANHLFIHVVGSGFTMPTTPPPVMVLSHIGGSVPVGDTANTMAFQSIVDGHLVPVQTPSIKSVGSFQDDKSLVVNTLPASFKIEQTLDVFLSTNSTINYAASTTLTSVAPEPGTLVTAAAGLPFAGLVLWRRRRRTPA